MEAPPEGSSKDGPGPVISFLTGPVHSGKTTFLEEAVRELGAGGFSLDGFLSVARGGGGREAEAGYDLVFLKTGRRIPFIRPEGGRDWEKTGSRRSRLLDPRGLAAAKASIRAGRGADLFIVDEAGPLELSGEGLWPALEEILKPPASGAGAYLLVVRERLLERLAAKLGLEEPAVLDIRDKDLSPAALAGLAASGRARRGNAGGAGGTIPAVKKTGGKKGSS